MTVTASIDIGSNSILLLALDENKKVILNEANVTGLGRGLDETGEFSGEAMKDSLEVFEKYHRLCVGASIDPKNVIVTATEASRVAKNSRSFFKEIKSKFEFEVQIITGEAEAYFSTVGVLADDNIQDPVITIMDIGGASTELIRVDVKERKILESFSMPVGVVRLNNWKAEGNRDENIAKVLKDYSSQLEKVADSKLYCVAGTMTSVGNMQLGHSEFVEAEVHGLEVTLDQIESLKTTWEGSEPTEILGKFPFLGKRSQTIQSGLYLASTVLGILKTERVYISTYGLRYGTILTGGIKDGFIFTR